jgi:hypothetical protein
MTQRFGGGSTAWLRLTESVWPSYAERAILAALAAFETKPPAAEQICDLADAIDAYADDNFYVAKVLAESALHRRSLDMAKRQPVRRSVEELRAAFFAYRSRRHAFPDDTN